MSAIYDNKENIKSNTHLDFNSFLEVCARIVIKKNKIFTLIFQKEKSRKEQEDANQIVSNVEQDQLDKRKEEFNNKEEEGDNEKSINDSEFYNNISNTPVSAFQGFLTYLKVPKSNYDFWVRTANKRSQP